MLVLGVLLSLVEGLNVVGGAAPYNGAPFLRSAPLDPLPSLTNDEENPNIQVERLMPNNVNSKGPEACELGPGADKGACLSVEGRECMFVHLEGMDPLAPIQATESHCMPCEMDGEDIPCWNVGSIVGGKRVLECEMRCPHQTKVREKEYACGDESGFITTAQCFDQGVRSGSKCMWTGYELEDGTTKSTCGPCFLSGTGDLGCPETGADGPEAGSTIRGCVSQCAVICPGPPACPPTLVTTPPPPPPSPGVVQTSVNADTMILSPTPLALPTPNPYAFAMQAMEAAKKAGWQIGTPPPPKTYDPVIMYRGPMDYMFTPGPPPNMLAAPAPPGALLEKTRTTKLLRR